MIQVISYQLPSTLYYALYNTEKKRQTNGCPQFEGLFASHSRNFLYTCNRIPIDIVAEYESFREFLDNYPEYQI